MDGNKDEALKCLKIGKHALSSGDRARALKFLSKARRLDPSLPLDDLLSAAREAGGAAAGGGPAAPPPASPAAPSPASPASSSARPYTDDQIAIVRQIKLQKDYYQILGLERGCTVEDVRKAYRKLSLKVHPDKNQAPGADEAFKSVSRAFQCLSNEEAKSRYDVVGTEEPDYNRPARRRHSQAFNGFYEDVDAEEIFRNFFFGGGMGGPGMRATTASFGPFGPSFHHHGGGGGSAGFSTRSLVQILPVIFLLLVNILPALFPSSEPVYELSKTYQYQYKYETQRGVMYFVKSARFEEEYPFESAERVSLEKRIEADYVGIVSRNCQQEMQRRQWGMGYQMPHCDMLQRYRDAVKAETAAA